MLHAPAQTLRRVVPRQTCLALREYSTGTISVEEDTRRSLRELLRETAQAVAVVTSLMPASELQDTQNGVHSQENPLSKGFHGATLSSFTSIALDPHPLVAFSLRVPSRMATSLNIGTIPTNSSFPPSSHMVINILSASQPHIAQIFSRPDLHPRPFEDVTIGWTSSAEGLPILEGALGALSCSVVGRSIPLSNVRWLWRRGEENDDEVQQVEGSSGLGSELFIARVLRVEKTQNLASGGEGDSLRTLPLLYHRRQYGTVRDLPRS
ncbi:hypothetical protein BV22DRAFT_1039762 [Leucogyrophana mollusca]|uniref:Uncharacterized protein n=1 Tax=Leucogyrophana mollusca TaxID=85980 RepID=A0ACB8B4E9_9AGAM|nr:hypothetical protein BV22DRAFT_1039762 [Leucogyrophana mollusca]